MTPFIEMEKLMKKSERLNDMMMFLDNKNSFNIKGYYGEYHISQLC